MADSQNPTLTVILQADTEEAITQLGEFTDQLDSIGVTVKKVAPDVSKLSNDTFQNLDKSVQSLAETSENLSDAFDSLQEIIASFALSAEKVNEHLDQTVAHMEAMGAASKGASGETSEQTKLIQQQLVAMQQQSTLLKQLIDNQTAYVQSVKNGTDVQRSWWRAIADTAKDIAYLAFAVNQVREAFRDSGSASTKAAEEQKKAGEAAAKQAEEQKKAALEIKAGAVSIEESQSKVKKSYDALKEAYAETGVFEGWKGVFNEISEVIDTQNKRLADEVSLTKRLRKEASEEGEKALLAEISAPHEAIADFMDENLDFFDENKDQWGNWKLGIAETLHQFSGEAEIAGVSVLDMSKMMSNGLDAIEEYFTGALPSAVGSLTASIGEANKTLAETGDEARVASGIGKTLGEVGENLVVTIGRESLGLKEKTRNLHENAEASSYLTVAEEKRLATEKKFLEQNEKKLQQLGHEATFWEKAKEFYNNPLGKPTGGFSAKHGIDVDALLAYKDGLQQIGDKWAPAAGQGVKKLLDEAVRLQLTMKQTLEVYNAFSKEQGGSTFKQLPAVKDEGSFGIFDPLLSMLGLGGAKAPSGSMDKDVVGQLLHIKQTASAGFTDFVKELAEEGFKAGEKLPEVFESAKDQAMQSGNFKLKSLSTEAHEAVISQWVKWGVEDKKVLGDILEEYSDSFDEEMPSKLGYRFVELSLEQHGNVDALLKDEFELIKNHGNLFDDEISDQKDRIEQSGLSMGEFSRLYADFQRREAEAAQKAHDVLVASLEDLKEKHSEVIKDLSKDIKEYEKAWGDAQTIFGKTSEEAEKAFRAYADKVSESGKKLVQSYTADMEVLSSEWKKADAIADPKQRVAATKTIEAAMKGLAQTSIQAGEQEYEGRKAVLDRITAEYERQAEQWAESYRKFAKEREDLEDRMSEAKKSIQVKGQNPLQEFITTTTEMQKRQEEAQKLYDEGTDEGIARAKKLWEKNVQDAKGLKEVYVSSYDLMSTADKHLVEQELEYYSAQKDLNQEEIDRQTYLNKLKKDKTVLLSEEYVKQVALGALDKAEKGLGSIIDTQEERANKALEVNSQALSDSSNVMRDLVEVLREQLALLKERAKSSQESTKTAEEIQTEPISAREQQALIESLAPKKEPWPEKAPKAKLTDEEIAEIGSEVASGQSPEVTWKKPMIDRQAELDKSADEEHKKALAQQKESADTKAVAKKRLTDQEVADLGAEVEAEVAKQQDTSSRGGSRAGVLAQEAKDEEDLAEQKSSIFEQEREEIKWRLEVLRDEKIQLADSEGKKQEDRAKDRQKGETTSQPTDASYDISGGGVSVGHVGTYVPGAVSREGEASDQSRRMMGLDPSGYNNKAQEDYEAAANAFKTASDAAEKVQAEIQAYADRDRPRKEPSDKMYEAMGERLGAGGPSKQDVLDDAIKEARGYSLDVSEGAMPDFSAGIMDSINNTIQVMKDVFSGDTKDIENGINNVIVQMGKDIRESLDNGQFENELSGRSAGMPSFDVDSMLSGLDNVTKAVVATGRKRIKSDITLDVLVTDANSSTTSFVRA